MSVSCRFRVVNCVLTEFRFWDSVSTFSGIGCALCGVFSGIWE